MAPQSLLRDLTAFAAAALSASAAVALLAAGHIVLAGTFTELEDLLLLALWVASETVPLAVVSCIAAAPFLFLIRRQRRLRLSFALGVFVLAMLLALLARTALLPRIAPEPSLLLAISIGVYALSGLVAGLAYWAIAKTPSNTTVETDARKNGARGSP